MAGLQRSAISFRRQGSSGLVWDEKFLAGQLNLSGELYFVQPKDQQDGEKKISRVPRPPRMQQDGEKKKPRVPRPPQIQRSQSNEESNMYQSGKDVRESIAGLQSSAISFRRRGSSGLVWDEKFFSGELNLSGELNQIKLNGQQDGEKKKSRVPRPPQIQGDGEKRRLRVPRPLQMECRSNPESSRYDAIEDVSPMIDPPSPKLSGCDFCGMFGRPETTQKHKQAKHKSWC